MPRKEEPKEILGLNRITKKRILELCKKDKLYQTPELNDVLYLHYQGFECIECLEDYTELKCLWLECNAISEIQGLEKLTKLKCLFLQSNLIRKIENLEFCKELDTLNLSQNHIRKIENCGFEVLPMLNTLNLSSNYLKDCEGLKELENCKNLSVLDLSNNRIDDILVVKIFAKMPELKVLVLQGNPVVSKIPQYRKTLILECKKLTYLDSRPVFPKDRACAEAWKRGGYEEERRENGRWNRKERKKMRDGVNATIQLRNKRRKPEDQISLIPSSDSEDDLETRKKQPQTPIGSDVNIDTIWDEVSEDISTERSFISNSSEKNDDGEMIQSIMDKRDNSKDIEIEQNKKEEKETKHNNAKDLISVISCVNKSSETDIKEYNFKMNVMQNEGKRLKIEEDKEQTFQINNINSNLDENNSHDVIDLNTNSKDKYQPVVEAIEMISRSQNYSPKEVQLYIENITKEVESVEDNYEPLKELDEKMEIFSKQEFEGQRKAVKIETLPSTEKEHETLKLNQQLKSDLEELSNNMCNFVKQLGEDQEMRQEVIKALFDKDIANKESSCESSESDGKEGLEHCKLDRVVDLWDKESTINSGVMENREILMKKNDENNLNKCLSQVSTNYIPMDISLLTRQSNDALDSLERESNNLKKLLQVLENKNEELFKVDKSEETCKVDKENNGSNSRDNECNQNIEIQDYETPIRNKEVIENLRAQDQEEVIKPIIEEILQSLDSFNSFCKDFETNNLVKNKELVDIQKKSTILKELAKQPNLKQFNSNTLENLDAQIAQINKERNTKVRRMIDRVYDQKDRYNDTLELVDDKLMVRNKDTNELWELPQPRQYESSDSEDDYDTAEDQSEDDAKGNEVYVKYQRKQNKQEQNNRSAFKPTARKSCEDIVINALILNQNRCIDNGDDAESNEEFYSLEPEDTSNLVNIDKEFFNKLTLDNLKRTDEHHIVQCARSYEELKHYLTVSKEERCLTEEDNELLENMIENKCNRNQEYNEDGLKSLQINTNLMKEQHLVSEDTKKETEELNLALTSSKEAIPLYEYKYDKDNENNINFDADETFLHENDENLMKKILLKEREIATKGNRLIESVDKTMPENVVERERHSEGEKNEIENNIDFERAVANEKFENSEFMRDVFENCEKEPEITINAENSGSDNLANKNTLVSDVEILECNLQIIGINDEIVDTITVNAELQF